MSSTLEPPPQGEPVIRGRAGEMIGSLLFVAPSALAIALAGFWYFLGAKTMEYPLPLLSDRDRRAAQALIEGAGLTFEPNFEDLVGVFSAGRLAGCGARSGRVIKMVVAAPEFRGEGLPGRIITELIRLGQEAGCDGFFIFTRPATSPAFESLGFKPLVAHEKAVLLEYGNGLNRYLRERAPLMRSGDNAALVISADPFTKGHDYLIERAATGAKTVYVFVPGEGSYVFPVDVRLELARRGTAHLNNVIVTDIGPYRLSAATFPTYFLSPDDQPDRIRIEIELDLFGKYIAPAFDIRTRVSGTEPLDPGARLYNQIMRRRLARWNVRLLEVEREKIGDLWINVKRVHKALAEGDIQSLAAYVPKTTLAYLKTPEAAGFLRKTPSKSPPC